MGRTLWHFVASSFGRLSTVIGSIDLIMRWQRQSFHCTCLVFPKQLKHLSLRRRPTKEIKIENLMMMIAIRGEKEKTTELSAGRAERTPVLHGPEAALIGKEAAMGNGTEDQIKVDVNDLMMVAAGSPSPPARQGGGAGQGDWAGLRALGGGFLVSPY